LLVVVILNVVVAYSDHLWCNWQGSTSIWLWPVVTGKGRGANWWPWSYRRAFDARTSMGLHTTQIFQVQSNIIFFYFSVKLQWS